MRQHTILFYTCTPPRENRQAAEPPTHSHTKKNIKTHNRNPDTGQRAFPNPADSSCSPARTASLLAGGAASPEPRRGCTPRTSGYQPHPSPRQEHQPHWGNTASLLVPQSQPHQDSLPFPAGLGSTCVTCTDGVLRATTYAAGSPKYLAFSTSEKPGCLFRVAETDTITVP